MNVFQIIGTLLHVLEAAPDLVDDVEDFWQKITGKQPVSDDHQAVMTAAITDARTP